MTTTEPSTQAPDWLNLDALLLDGFTERTQELAAEAVVVYESAQALAKRVDALKDHWEGVARWVPGEVAEIVAEVTGFQRMDDALLLASHVLLNAWDPHSIASDEHIAELRQKWGASGGEGAVPGAVQQAKQGAATPAGGDVT